MRRVEPSVFIITWVFMVFGLMALTVAAQIGLTTKEFVVQWALLTWVSSIVMDILRFLFSKF